jgi:predicted alpha/beta-fold hydrolase
MNLEQLHFEPHPMVRGGHLQTIIGRISRNNPSLIADQTITIDLSDGDRTSCLLNFPESHQSDQVVVALFHGLGGCAESPYNRRVTRKLLASNFIVARYNHRGCDSTFTSQGIYHGGSSEDIYSALEQIATRFPTHRILPIGFSLSGNILINVLSDFDTSPAVWTKQILAAIAVCPPLDLELSSRQITRLDNLLYDQYFARLLKKHVRKVGIQPPSRIPRFFKLRDFDEFFTAPVAGFLNRSDYYKRSSPLGRFEHISTPLIILGAADDPVVHTPAYMKITRLKMVRSYLCDSGGHMGFISRNRTRFGDHRWMDEFIVTAAETFRSPL